MHPIGGRMVGVLRMAWRFKAMWVCTLLVGVLLISGSASGQGFAFLNGKEAHDNCGEAASEAERAEAISAAEGALSRGPSALPHLHIDKLLPHQGIRDKSEAAERDWPAARDLAVGYCVTGRADFRDHATAIVTDWAKRYRPDYNPVDEGGMQPLFLAADLLADSMSPPDASAWQSFARKIAEGYTERAEQRSGVDIDGRQSRRIELAAMAAYAIDDDQLVGRVQAAWTDQIGHNVNADGSVYDYTRHDALRPVVADLEPMVIAALTAHDHGSNWYGVPAPNGSTLESALSWLVPYVRGTNTHVEYQNSHDPFDYARKNAGEPGFGGLWQPANAASLYLYASAIDLQWGELATQLNGRAALWQRLMMDMP
ncbi:MAG: alginate lyase family protein [Acidobacteriaceae bacterium]